MRDRRQFIKSLSVLSTGSICLSSVAVSTVLQGCSTIDEQLIKDPRDLDQTVIIVGGGITGLYAAYQLENEKFHIEFLKVQVDWVEKYFQIKTMNTVHLNFQIATVICWL